MDEEHKDKTPAEFFELANGMASRREEAVKLKEDFNALKQKIAKAKDGADKAKLIQEMKGLADRRDELMNQAEVNLRWPRWNASAPAAERQRKLEIAMRALQTLLSYAPDNRSVQKALAEVRRSLAGLSRGE